jgi:hypothetical protein
MLVDVQTEMLVAARQRLARAANVWYGAADACALPIRTGQSDAVFLATMLGEVPDKDLCIEEVRRIRRPGNRHRRPLDDLQGAENIATGRPPGAGATPGRSTLMLASCSKAGPSPTPQRRLQIRRFARLMASHSRRLASFGNRVWTTAASGPLLVLCAMAGLMLGGASRALSRLCRRV